jgi:demethylmenaquinone methyltransferase / 2-methoxy-6-polyprenyl-1,4-benzoquinol methylase
MPQADAETYFGFRAVDPGGKQALVDEVFHKVARRYDLMNDLMSGGLHRAWKNAMVAMLKPPKDARPFAVIDVAGGTGDIAFRLAETGGGRTRVTVCDINFDMLAVGRERVHERGDDDRIDFVAGNAECLPFPDRACDAVTIAFGIRNVPRIDVALGEFYRVLRPGGRFVCLEFSTVDVPGLDALYDLYSSNVIPALGRLIVGDAAPYRYLVESIRRFPKPQAFAEAIAAAGFRRVSYRVLAGGVVALHSGWRL